MCLVHAYMYTGALDEKLLEVVRNVAVAEGPFLAPTTYAQESSAGDSNGSSQKSLEKPLSEAYY